MTNRKEGGEKRKSEEMYYNLSKYKHQHLRVCQKIAKNDRNKETRWVTEIELGTLNFCNWVSLLFSFSFFW